MYLEADIKVTKMYRKGEMRRKKCKREREREREGGGGGGGGRGRSGMTETQTVKEEESKKEERNSNTVKKLLGQLRGTLPVCKNQLIKAALMTYNN